MAEINNNSQSIADKICDLLLKEKDAILADIQNEILGVQFALEDDANHIQENIDALQLSDAVGVILVRLGISFSDTQVLNGLAKTLGECLDKLAEAGEKFKDKDYDDGTIALMEVLHSILSIIRTFLDDEVTDTLFEEVQQLFSNSSESLKSKAKEIASRIAQHALTSLLKNAREVFADEIEYVRLQGLKVIDNVESIKSGIEDTINEQRKKIEGAISDAQKKINSLGNNLGNELDGMWNELKNDSDLVNLSISKAKNDVTKELIEIAERHKEDPDFFERIKGLSIDDNIYETISRVFTITYSLLDFLGIVCRKTYTLSFPKSFTKQLAHAKNSVTNGMQDLVSDVSSAVGGAVSDAKNELLGAVRKVSAIETDISQSVSNLKNSAQTAIKTATNEVANDMNDGLSKIAGQINISQASAATAALQVAITNYTLGINNNSSAAMDSVDKWLSGIKGDVQNGAQEAWQNIQGKGEELMNELMSVNKSIASAANTLNNNIDTLLQNIENFSYPIEVVVIDFDSVTQLFTNPIKHFKKLYPIESYDDAQKLIERFVNLLHLICPDIPDFNSLVALLETLLKRVKRFLLEKIEEWKNMHQEELNALTMWINRLENMLQLMYDMAKQLVVEAEAVVKDVEVAINAIGSQIEAIANIYYKELQQLTSEVSNNAEIAQKNIQDAIDAIKEKADSELDKVLKELQSGSQSMSDDAKAALSDLINAIKAINVRMPKLDINVNTDIIAPAIYKVLDIDIDNQIDDIKTSLEDSCKKVTDTAKVSMQNWLNGVGASISAIVSPSMWSDRLDLVLGQLKKELQSNIDNLTSLISQEGARQLLTNRSAIGKTIKDSLDINGYVNIIKSGVSDVVLPNPELYYSSFKEQVVNKIKEALESQKSNLLDAVGSDEKKRLENLFSDLKDNAEQWVEKIAIELWKKVKESIINPIVDSIKQALIQAIREVVKINIKRILNLLLTDDMPSLKQLSNIYAVGKEHIEKVVDTTKDLQVALTDFMLSDMSFVDIVKLVSAIVKSVPSEIVEHISNVLPSLPEGVTNFVKDATSNMNYECDLNNKIVSVTLFDLETLLAKRKVDNSVNAQMKLQLTLKIDNYKYGENDSDTTPAINIFATLKGGVDYTFNIGDNHEMTIGAAGSLGYAQNDSSSSTDGVLGFCITKNVDGGYFHPLAGKEEIIKSIGVFISLFFQRKSDKVAQWLSTKYLDINVKNYPQVLYLGYNMSPKENVHDSIKGHVGESSDGFQFGYIAGINDLELVFKLKENTLFKTFLKDDISLTLNAYLGYDLKEGLKIDGGYKIHYDFDINGKKLGNLLLNGCSIDIGSVGTDWKALSFNFGSSFQIDFSALTLSFDNLGLGFDLKFLTPDFKFGDFSFTPTFKWPDGIGIGIDTSCVKGTGFISYDSDSGEIMGALELSIINKFGVSGFLLLDTGSKPGHSFSMAVMISARFSPGIPLGMGFSLTAIGGCLGINRKLDRLGIMTGVRQGTLGSVFFVENLSEHLAEFKKSAEQFFPTQKNQFYVGLLGQISFEPIVKCDFGLLLQLPNPVEIIIIGALRISAGEATDKLISINVYFAGGINFEEGIWFDASIVDSQIVGLSLSGDMAFRLNWGGPCKGFLMSIGGFHPAYKPEEGMYVSDMRRISVGLNYGIIKFNLDTYLAITSNSFQIGANLYLQVGWEKFGIVGYAGFDALFQFDPFLFMFDLRAGVSVKCGSWTLLSIDLKLAVSGPAPWKVSGSAKFYFIFIPIKVSFDLSWGKDVQSLPSAEVNVMELFTKEWDNPLNWTSLSNEEDEYIVHRQLNDTQSDMMILEPFANISFNQSAVPLNFDMDICNNARPIDYTNLSINYSKMNEGYQDGGLHSVEQTNDFAPALFKQMTIKEKLDSKSYEAFESGFILSADGCKLSNATDLNLSYDHVKKDSNPIFEHNPAIDVRHNYAHKDKASFSRYVKSMDSKMNKK